MFLFFKRRLYFSDLHTSSDVIRAASTAAFKDQNRLVMVFYVPLPGGHFGVSFYRLWLRSFWMSQREILTLSGHTCCDNISIMLSELFLLRLHLPCTNMCTTHKENVVSFYFHGFFFYLCGSFLENWKILLLCFKFIQNAEKLLKNFAFFSHIMF